MNLESSFITNDQANNNLEDEKDNVLTDKRLKAIHKIFKVYSKQHIAYHDTTFEQFEEKSNTIILADYLKFCKDFSLWKDLNLSKETLTSIFYKGGQNHSPLNFDQFIASL